MANPRAPVFSRTENTAKYEDALISQIAVEPGENDGQSKWLVDHASGCQGQMVNKMLCLCGQSVQSVHAYITNQVHVSYAFRAGFT